MRNLGGGTAITRQMAVIATLAETRAWDAFAVSARRLERQLQSADPEEVQQALRSVEERFLDLTPTQRGRVPELAAQSAALRKFLRWRALPRDQKTTVVDLRASTAKLTPKMSEASRELLSSAARAETLAFMGDRNAWLYRAGRMLLVAAGSDPKQPEIAARLAALSARFLRHGDTTLGQAFARAADGDLGPARRLMNERRAQLGSKPLDETKVRFGATIAEKSGDTVRINGASIPAADWARIEEARDKTLALYRNALSKPYLQTKPIDGLDAMRRFIMLGRPAIERLGLFADRAALHKVRGPLVEQLKALKTSGKKVLIYVEGHDAAGKGSSSHALLVALKEAGFETRTQSFKGPTAEERKQHWLERFKKSAADNPGVLVWDRGPAGNWAYGNPPPEALAELHAFEDELKKDTVVLKLNLRAEPERQAETFGKRWARALIAEELLESKNLSAAERDGLRAIVDTTLSPNDLPAYANFASIDAKFAAFTNDNSASIPWHTVDTTSRTVAKEKALALFKDVIAAAL